MDSSISPGAGSMTYIGRTPSITDQPAPSFTDQIADRLKTILGTVGEADMDLSMLYERTFGAVAVAGSVGDSAPQPINSRADAIFDLLDMLQRRAASVASTARDLNSRI